MKYQKKPVVIEAIQWDGTRSGIELIKAQFTDMETCGLSGWRDKEEVSGWQIRTLEGAMNVSNGDFIIKGVKGEFYPCKPDIFALTYEPAPEGEKE